MIAPDRLRSWMHVRADAGCADGVRDAGAFVAKVTATDPMVFLPTTSVLLAVGMLAAAIPALRASRIDPIATLRQE